jgi:site-specific recombinase XerD
MKLEQFLQEYKEELSKTDKSINSMSRDMNHMISYVNAMNYTREIYEKKMRALFRELSAAEVIRIIVKTGSDWAKEQ